MGLRQFVDKIKPNFEKGGKLHAFRSVFGGFETFLFVPNHTAKSGSNIHDCFDSKRMMIMVCLALVPALLFGMYNVGLQHYSAAVATGALAAMPAFWSVFGYGFLAVLPKIIVSYLVGLGIEFTVAQWKGEEIHEGFLVSGLIIPMIVPVGTPLWIIALATAFAVIFAKEIYGGTGMNIFNVALVTRAFIFFAYPSVISGDAVWVATDSIFGLGADIDGFTAATALGQAAVAEAPAFDMSMVWGFIPGSIGETSVVAIALGALILLGSGIASWKTMLSVFVGGGLMAWVFNQIGNPENAVAMMPWYQHLALGGFCFGAVFMATDPVTSCRTECGKYIYGFLIGVVAILIRVLNPGYPEGMMLAILLMNLFAPLIDYYVYQSNISKRAKRAANSK
ncbi:MAG: NADH:ubiquinone reductase (Na(+)-transporting) subunit B [Bacteroidaceae bacterium]|nr:NADH:ubiquinone reductase (Na(+)-transporting) subunit B [Bacteroidaceae bacterium]